MAVISINGFRTQPGHLAEHLAGTAEALDHLRRLEVQAATFQAIAGADVGTITTILSCASNADYVATMQRVQADEAWQEFWLRVNGLGAAVQVESSLFVDVDASYQPSSDRPIGAVLATQWRPRPGRIADFMGNVMASIPHITRMGGTPRTMQSVIGLHPLTVLVSTGFESLEAYAEYADKLPVDQEWQAFWLGVLADPTADLIRAGLYVNTSG